MAKRLKIAVYSIAKNEQDFAKRWFDSTQGADHVLVGVDPGDTTGEALESLGCRVVRVDLPRFRFDHYRNEVLRHIPYDVDVCVSLDLDEVLPAGWRQLIEQAWERGTTRLHYLLQWSADRLFQYDRIHARHHYTWRHATHEALSCSGKERIAKCYDLIITHLPDQSKDRSKNMPLLKMAVEEDPEDHRMWWYLGRELYYDKQWQAAIDAFQTYLQLPRWWGVERAWACIFMGRCYIELNKHGLAECVLHAGVSMQAGYRDSLFELAMLYFKQEKYDIARRCMLELFKIRTDEFQYMEMNGAWGGNTHLLMAKCCAEEGRWADYVDEVNALRKLTSDYAIVSAQLEDYEDRFIHHRTK